MPRVPAAPNMRKVKANVYANGYTHANEKDSLSRWMTDNVPSLKEMFRPAWWLPK